MSCGPGKGLEKLQEAQKAAQDAIAELEGNISGGIASLQSKLESVTGSVMGSLKEMMPQIELPEIPNLTIELPTLELPELPQIESLQGEIGSLINKINSPEFKNKLNIPVPNIPGLPGLPEIPGLNALDKEIESIKAKFGDAVPNLDALIEDAKSGKIDINNLCKLVPNVEKDPTKEGTVEKGAPTTAPETDAVELAAPAEVPTVETEVGAATIKKKEEIKAKTEQATASSQKVNNLGYGPEEGEVLQVKTRNQLALDEMNNQRDDLLFEIRYVRENGPFDENGRPNGIAQEKIADLKAKVFIINNDIRLLQGGTEEQKEEKREKYIGKAPEVTSNPTDDAVGKNEIEEAPEAPPTADEAVKPQNPEKINEYTEITVGKYLIRLYSEYKDNQIVHVSSVNGRMTKFGVETLDVKLERANKLKEPQRSAILKVLNQHKSSIEARIET